LLTAQWYRVASTALPHKRPALKLSKPLRFRRKPWAPARKWAATTASRQELMNTRRHLISEFCSKLFRAKGNEGLVNALEKMPSKGRLSITGTLGGDLAYIRRFDQEDGSVMLRMVTNRLLRFGEVWADTRTTDYQLSALEVIFSKDGKKKTGRLLPAARLDLDKSGRLEIELYQNPWNLVNIQLR
jgi:hypothetical protein